MFEGVVSWRSCGLVSDVGFLWMAEPLAVLSLLLCMSKIGRYK